MSTPALGAAVGSNAEVGFGIGGGGGGSGVNAGVNVGVGGGSGGSGGAGQPPAARAIRSIPACPSRRAWWPECPTQSCFAMTRKALRAGARRGCRASIATSSRSAGWFEPRAADPAPHHMARPASKRAVPGCATRTCAYLFRQRCWRSPKRSRFPTAPPRRARAQPRISLAEARKRRRRHAPGAAWARQGKILLVNARWTNVCLNGALAGHVSPPG